jgi:undecaprenyl-diphosphatase
MLELLIELDKSLFLLLNGLHHPVADFIMLAITNKYTWIPAYILLILWIFRKYGMTTEGWMIIAGILLVILLADQTASGLLKPLVGRLRPCFEPNLSGLVHLPGKCGGKYGFVSSHAANHFGMAIFLITLFKNQYPQVKWLWLWAGIIAYSRIYVGVHYPADVIVGGLIGLLYGFAVAKLYLRYFPLKNID